MFNSNESHALALNTHNGMGELIPISEYNGKRAVSARELHAFLESKQEFSNWIKGRIEKYGFIENVDFEVFDNFVKNPAGGRPLTEYALSMDMAKELSMVEGNEKGKQARQYFIEQDKKAQQLQKPMSTLDILELTIKELRSNNQELQEVKKDVHELKARVTTRPNFFTIAGYGTLIHMSVNMRQAGILGRKATKICKERGIEIDKCPDPRFGTVGMYPIEVLEEVFNEPIN